MAKTIDQILGYVFLTGLIENIKTGIPDRLPAKFNTLTKKTLGIQGRYTRVQGTRTTARLVQYGAPALRRAMKGIDAQDVKLLSTKESFFMNYLMLRTLRNYTNYDVQQNGIEEIERQQLQFRTNFDNLRMAAKYSMLANGKIWWDGSGNLLPSSSSAVETVDFLMSANNQNQLNNLISASWAANNTDIPGQLRAIKRQAAQLTGYNLDTIYYGINIPSYLSQNNYVLDYLARNPGMNQKYVDSGEVPNGLFGFDWTPVYTAFYEDSAGTNQKFFGDDAAIFTPEIDQSWYELMEGTDGVPTTFAPAANMSAAMTAIKEVQGMASYAVQCVNPIGAEMFTLDNFLPVLKVPNAIFQADVTP